MSHSLTLLSPAKLNLFLHINGRRPDGYHELQTLFQLLDFGDTLHFEKNQSGTVRLKTPLPGVPEGDNLIVRAAKLLLPHRKSATDGTEIAIDKQLPMGGGIGGGSSNAATTLLALNKLWNCQLSVKKLAELGRNLGADVPVFVHGHSAFAEGVGEILQAVELPEYWYLVLTPDCHVSTAEIFSNELLTRDTPKIKIAPALEGQGFSKTHNDCEALVKTLYPPIGEAINWLNQFGTGRLTGTGACCFCRFESEAEARQVLNEARSTFKGFIAKGVNLSPAHQRLNEAD